MMPLDLHKGEPARARPRTGDMLEHAPSSPGGSVLDDSAMRDITNRADIANLVVTFYGRAFHDELLGPVFVDVAQLDLEAHLPTMCDFWESVLLGARSYGGGAFVPHAHLHARVPLTQQHFERWLAIWTNTVRGLHTGPVAEDAIARAQRVATAFHGRLWHGAERVSWISPD
jgi:hemoglobin